MISYFMVGYLHWPLMIADVNLAMVKLKGFLTLQKKWKTQLL